MIKSKHLPRVEPRSVQKATSYPSAAVAMLLIASPAFAADQPMSVAAPAPAAVDEYASHETSLFDEKGQRRADFALADVLGVRYRDTFKAAPRRVTLLPGNALAFGLPEDAPLTHDEPVVAVTLAGAESAGSFAEDQPAVLTHRYPYGLPCPRKPVSQKCAVFGKTATWLRRSTAGPCM